MSDGENALKNFANCIPQVYFDILGRVIPGILIMGSIWIAVRGLNKFWEDFTSWLNESTISSATLATALVLLTSYTLSILLWCPWSRWISKKCTNSKASKIKGYLEKMYWDTEEFRVGYETVKYNNISAGNRITKLKAQIHMSETLLVGFPLSVFLGLIYSVVFKTYPFVSWVCMLIAAFCSYKADLYFIAHMKDSLKNNLRLLEKE